MDYPEVVICLVTFKRTEYAIQVVEGLKANLKYPNLSWHIADDGSGEAHQNAIIEAIGDQPWTLTDAKQAGGTGHNRNLGLQAAFSRTDYVLHIEDDWVLTRPYILEPAVVILRDYPEVGMIRMGYIEEGHIGRSRNMAGLMWWQLDKHSGHGFVFAGHPHMLHRRFHENYGWYDENLLPGPTEIAFAEKFLKGEGPQIIYPMWVFGGFFSHIGTVKAQTLL